MNVECSEYSAGSGRCQNKRFLSFPIPIDDAKGTTLFAEFKAITLMRWIRKSIEDKTFQLVKS